MPDTVVDTTVDSVTEPVAKPWYLSRTILSLVAGILIALTGKFAVNFGITLPESLTTESTIQFLTVVIPMAIAIYGRVNARHTITGSAAGAETLNNAAVAKGVPVAANIPLPVAVALAVDAGQPKRDNVL